MIEGEYMKTIKKTVERLEMKAKLSLFWLVAMLAYTYGDVVTLMDPVKHGSMQLTQGFLLGASIFMAIPIVMVLLSRVLDHQANRVLNIVTGSIMSVALVLTLFVAVPTMYYVFFTAMEVACTVFIVVAASRWSVAEEVPALAS
jgi:hypothetical protein